MVRVMVISNQGSFNLKIAIDTAIDNRSASLFVLFFDRSNLIAITVAQRNFSIISIQEVNNFATRIRILQTPN